jgi:hypothetical protein
LVANSNGAFSAIDTNVNLVANSGAKGRLLLHHAVNPVDNQVYDLIQQGDGGSPWILQVYSGTNTATTLAGAHVYVQGGVQQAGNEYGYQAYAAIVEGTTRIFFWLNTPRKGRNFITRILDEEFLWGAVNSNATALNNGLGLSTSVSGGTVTNQAVASSSKIGVVRLDTGLTSNGRAGLLTLVVGAGVELGLDTGLHAEFRLNVPTSSDGTNTWSCQVGLSDNITPSPNNAVSITFQPLVSTTDWELLNSNAGTPNNTSLGTLVAAQDEHFIIHKDPGDPNIYVIRNGVQVAATSTDVPTTNPISPVLSIVKSAGTSVSGKLDMDSAVADYYTPLGRGA